MGRENKQTNPPSHVEGCTSRSVNMYTKILSYKMNC